MTLIIDFKAAHGAQVQARSLEFYSRNQWVYALMPSWEHLKTKLEDSFGLPVSVEIDTERGSQPFVASFPDSLGISTRGSNLEGRAFGFGDSKAMAVASMYVRMTRELHPGKFICKHGDDGQVSLYRFDARSASFFLYQPGQSVSPLRPGVPT